MAVTKKYLAFDVGASNGRCVVGSFDGSRLTLEVLSRFNNGYIRLRDHLYWNILGLYEGVRLSLRQAAVETPDDLTAIGIDTWGVDFGLLDARGDLIANPYCYRDPHTVGMMETAFQIVPKEEIFQVTGLQFMELNTLYQLLAMLRAGSPVLKIAETFLLIPDLLNYWLTGCKVCEYTNASITQLANAQTRTWDFPFINRFGIPSHIFPEILAPGQPIGPLNSQIRSETGLPGLPVIAVGSHDTASAVVAVPATLPDFAYLSSGTWGLEGIEIPQPLIDPKVLAYNLGNEGGVFNSIRLLRNVINMWLVQECERAWASGGNKHTWDELIQLAEAAQPFMACIDPDDPRFILPEDMPRAIQGYCQETGQAVPQTPGAILRVIFESLAMKYRYNIAKLADVLGTPLQVFHIVGGASRNRLLNQFAANATRLPVIAGPSEATALGNLIIQLIAVGDLKNLREGRQLIAASFPLETYTPTEADTWEEQYTYFLKTTALSSIPRYDT